MKTYAHVRNKRKRQELVQKAQAQRVREKAILRRERARTETKNPALREARVAKNIPQTLETLRRPNENALGQDAVEELLKEWKKEGEEDEEEEGEDAARPRPADVPKAAEPKILVTTSRYPGCQSSRRGSTLSTLISDLLDCFPSCAKFAPRPNDRRLQIKDIAQMASERAYTHLLVVNCDRKRPNALTTVRLPAGPSMYFSLTSYVPIRRIHHHGRATSHIPELILNNFSATGLGFSVGKMFHSLWPAQPQIDGRQVVTLHNQRDYIFFRRHRYVFRNEEKVGLQELGPQFTLKLRRLERGIWDLGQLSLSGEAGEVEWEWHPRMEKDRRAFQL